MPGVRQKAHWPAGKVIRLSHESDVLKSNPWQDPTQREVCIYLPANYDPEGNPMICLWDLAAFTNSGQGHANWSNHGENLPQRLDRLIGETGMPPCVVVMPDCYTSLGGNQYVNSGAVGRYADYLVDELVPFVSSNINVIDHRNGRGIFGKSSGGYGALYHAMNWPNTWGAAASHAGDVGFEWVFKPAFPDASKVLAAYNGDLAKFVRAFWAKNRPHGRDFQTLLVIAMAASYDPDSQSPATVSLPFDIQTLEISNARWDKWLSFDPLMLIEQHADSLASLHALHIDVGTHDQYNIQFGTRRLFSRLKELGVDGQFEEFDGSHSGIDWRLDHSLPYLVNALSVASGVSNKQDL